MSIMIARTPVRPMPQVRQSGSDVSRAVWLFVVGASVAVDVPIMGRVMGPDVLCTIGLLVLLSWQGFRNFQREAKLFFLMIGLWLFGAIITDVIRGTAVEDIVRGWSKLFFFGITFGYLYLATRGRLSLIVFFLIGLNAGALVTLLTTPDEFFFTEPWKFGYGNPITIFVMACISTPFFRQVAGSWGQIAATMAIAAINLMENSRAIFAILLAVACIVTLGVLFGKLLRGRPVPKLLFMFTLLGCGIFYQGVIRIYGTAASSGMLGPEAQEKYEWQTESGLGVLLGGRAESLVSTQAIADSPIIGHGSWARDYGYVTLYVEALEKRGAAIMGDPYGSSSGLIPSHSFLLGSWVEAGILGGLFWIYVLAVCGRSLYSLLHIPPWSRPLVTFVTLLLIWDVLFSPFAAQQRFFVPAEFCVVLWAIRNEQWKTSLQRRKAGAAT
jgi:O-antigen ligase